jgi:hypothetical protein
LYVSHDKEVGVLDLDSEKVVGKVPGSDVHGIAINHELGRGFISASDPGSVTIFDLTCETGTQAEAAVVALLDTFDVSDNIMLSAHWLETTLRWL